MDINFIIQKFMEFLICVGRFFFLFLAKASKVVGLLKTQVYLIGNVAVGVTQKLRKNL